jgi:4-amino-4-deoxy-L-arabinose transferase-like glycosyltransferase
LATERHTIEPRSAAPPAASPFERARTAVRRVPPAAGIGTGLALGVGSLIAYDGGGTSTGMLLLWFAALLTLGVTFWSQSSALPRIAVRDLAATGLLMLAFVPLYLLAVYRWPVQVSSDEIAIMDASRTYSEPGHGADLLGPSHYLGRPTLLFAVWGNLGQLIGGIDLFHMRLVHGFVGLLVIAAGYALFRQLLPRRWALFAAFVLGVSHSLFMISRLAMRENTAVLVEVVALALLLWGLRRDHALATLAGGVVAGLGFYVYFPARATFPIWVAFLVGAALFFRSRFPAPQLLRLGAVATVGLVLIAGPIVIAERDAGPQFSGGQAGQGAQLLITDEGREVQRQWVFADTWQEGMKKNIRYGLGTFNNDVVDHSWIYENHGHGFVDPLTGILLWIGAGIAIVALVRRRAGPGVLLGLGGFLILWLSFAFIVNKAPNYTRLLITLPFVAFLVTVAVRWIGERVQKRFKFRHGVAAVAVGAAALLGVWNVSIGWDFVQKGRANGDDIGSTGRFIASVRDRPGQSFYMAASSSIPYYKWGEAGMWMSRMRLFARNGQSVSVVEPLLMKDFQATPPFSVFMRSDVWINAGPALTDRYPQIQVKKIVPNGTLVVADVPKA